MNEALFSSKKMDYCTPQAFFDQLNEEFHFTLDPCANEENHKCDLFYTKEQDGLTKDWGDTLFSAILRMEKRLRTGFATLTSSHRNPTLLLLC